MLTKYKWVVIKRKTTSFTKQVNNTSNLLNWFRILYQFALNINSIDDAKKICQKTKEPVLFCNYQIYGSSLMVDRIFVVVNLLMKKEGVLFVTWEACNISLTVVVNYLFPVQNKNYLQVTGGIITSDAKYSGPTETI